MIIKDEKTLYQVHKHIENTERYLSDYDIIQCADIYLHKTNVIYDMDIYLHRLLDTIEQIFDKNKITGLTT